MMEFFSIGVYHSSEEEFFAKLQRNEVDTFLDIRRRRGIRGKDYSFANSKKLQEQLQKMNICYHHVPALAPTKSMIQAQEKLDQDKGISRRARKELGVKFKKTYKQEILANYDLERLVRALNEEGAHKVVLFCVEELAEACHRSIVLDAIKKKEYIVKHL